MPLLVNGELIDDSLLRQQTARARLHLLESMDERDPIALEARAREWARETLIESALLRQAALSDPTPIPPELVEEAIVKLGPRTPGTDNCFLPGDDVKFRRQIETELRVDRLIAKLSANLAPPRNQDVTQYYRKHRESFYLPERVHAAHIVKNVDEQTDEDVALFAIRRAENELRHRSFEEIAAEFSDCPGNGDLGFFERGQMVEEFEKVVFAMDPGQVSGIFRTPFGFHIAKVYERKPEGICDLDEVRDVIRQGLFRSKKEKVISQFVDALRAKADIRTAATDLARNESHGPRV